MLIFLLLQLCHHTYKERHIIAETLTDFVNRIRAILNCVVEECSHYRIDSQSHFLNYDACHSHRMTDIWFA